MTIASDKDAPYPGLRPYRENEKDKFFGRDADTQILIDKVLTNRLTLLFAASGVGKSSLLQAAIMPHLKSPSGENLSVVYYRDWVSEPLSGVRTAVLMALQEQHLLPDDAEEEGDNLPELLGFCSLFIRSPLVLILDQFEEFFRYQRTQGSFQPFIDQLTLVITAKDLPVNIILSMREDFALELNAFKPRLPTLLFDNFYRLEKLDRESTRKAILTPVENLGYTYEPLLLDLLLDDLLSRELDRNPQAPIAELRMYVEPPYLQIVCAHLWELNKNDPAKTLRLKTYEKVGKAKGILKNYIENALKPFNYTEKLLASRAFDHLISQRGVKMAYTAKALADITRLKQADLQIVLDKLEQLRILRRQARGEETWYELYHDMFSPSLESWNNHFKDELRRRRLLKLSTGLVAGIAAIIVGWDYYINATSYYLKLSPKQGISDQIEVWQGKLGSFDFFHQSHYISETDNKRHELESDKLFYQKELINFKYIYDEIIENFSLTERLYCYYKIGNYKKISSLENHYDKTIINIIGFHILSIYKDIYSNIKNIETNNTSDVVSLISNNSFSQYSIKYKYHGFLNGYGLFNSLEKENVKSLSDIKQIFWENHFLNEISNSFSRNILYKLNKIKSIYAILNSPSIDSGVVTILKDSLQSSEEEIRIVSALAIGQLQLKTLLPNLIKRPLAKVVKFAKLRR